MGNHSQFRKVEELDDYWRKELAKEPRATELYFDTVNNTYLYAHNGLLWRYEGDGVAFVMLNTGGVTP
jgi:hypothetical protein